MVDGRNLAPHSHSQPRSFLPLLQTALPAMDVDFQVTPDKFSSDMRDYVHIWQVFPHERSPFLLGNRVIVVHVHLPSYAGCHAGCIIVVACPDGRLDIINRFLREPIFDLPAWPPLWMRLACHLLLHLREVWPRDAFANVSVSALVVTQR